MPGILNRQAFLVHLRGQTQLLPLIHQSNKPIGVVHVLLSNLWRIATSPFATLPQSILWHFLPMIVAYLGRLLSAPIRCCVEHCAEHGEFICFNTANAGAQHSPSSSYLRKLVHLCPRHFAAMSMLGYTVSSEHVRSALGRQFWSERIPNVHASGLTRSEIDPLLICWRK